MKKITFLLFTILTASFCFSQDVITKSDGEEVKAKVLEVTQAEIKYKKFDNPNGPTFTILKKEVFMIRYENGSKDVFNSEKESKTSNEDVNIEMFEKGKRDAQLQYKGKNSGAIWTGAAAAFTLPILGLIPALITSNAEPQVENLGVRDQKLFKNPDYKAGYVEAAHKKKKRRVWSGFGIGSAVFVATIFILPVLAQ
jgi:hypothetical protein